MTREEAIQVLNTYDVNFDEYTAEEIADAIDMAIEALKADTVEIKPIEIKGDFRIDDCIYCSPKIVGNVEVVVRCKDCRFYSNDHLCEQLSRFGSIEPLADFYCAFGERREP